MDISIKGGQQLKRLREQLGLTMRDVEMASSSIAAKFQNQEFVVNISRLSDIETKGVLPTIYRLFSLAAIYGVEYSEVCGLYGVDFQMQAVAHKCAHIPKSHMFKGFRNGTPLDVPTIADPSFDVRRTTNLMRMIQKWGTVPASFLSELANSGHTYAFVGTEDLTNSKPSHGGGTLAFLHDTYVVWVMVSMDLSYTGSDASIHFYRI